MPKHSDELTDSIMAEIMAQSDPDRALSDSFDALIMAFGMDAVRCMAVEKLEAL